MLSWQPRNIEWKVSAKHVKRQRNGQDSLYTLTEKKEGEQKEGMEASERSEFMGKKT